MTRRFVVSTFDETARLKKATFSNQSLCLTFWHKAGSFWMKIWLQKWWKSGSNNSKFWLLTQSTTLQRLTNLIFLSQANFWRPKATTTCFKSIQCKRQSNLNPKPSNMRAKCNQLMIFVLKLSVICLLPRLEMRADHLNKVGVARRVWTRALKRFIWAVLLLCWRGNASWQDHEFKRQVIKSNYRNQGFKRPKSSRKSKTNLSLLPVKLKRIIGNSSLLISTLCMRG